MKLYLPTTAILPKMREEQKQRAEEAASCVSEPLLSESPEEKNQTH